MKKFNLIAALLCCSLLTAAVPERVESLVAKAILHNTEGYFVLSDGSLWKAAGFSKRSRTLSEWWNNVQLVPENYECVPEDWFLGTYVTIYSKYETLNVNEADAVNQDSLQKCTHLLVNNNTGKILFATHLHPAEGVILLFNDAYQDGHSVGYQGGYVDGYSLGYRVGYDEGYSMGNSQSPSEL